MKGNFQKVSFRRLRRKHLPGEYLFFPFLLREISNYLTGTFPFQEKGLFAAPYPTWKKKTRGFEGSGF